MRSDNMNVIPLPKEKPETPPMPPMPPMPVPPKPPGECMRENGLLFMDKDFNQENCMPIVKMIMEYNLMAEDDAPNIIHLYINSPGGSVTAGLSIYDTMQFIKPDVSTLCLGQAASMGAFLLAGGAKGKRHALPNSRMMIHQVLGGYQGQASDIEIHTQEILKIKNKLNKILASHTGQKLDKIIKDSDRDNFMSSEEAAKYGLIDSVVGTRTKE